MAEKPDMRAAALDTLVDMDKNKKLSHIAIGDTLIHYQFVPKQERAFYTHLCEGVMERRIYLDYILDSFSKTPMKKCKPLIRNLLRMSAYQILYMHVPDSAACNEAVTLAKKRGFRNLTGFVNGVLRTVVRQKEQLPMPSFEQSPTKYYAILYSMPEWIVQLILEQYGREKAQKIFSAFLEVKPLTIRTNLAKITVEQLKQCLEEEKVTVREGKYLSYALSLENVNYLGKLPSFRNGYFSVQDESSMLPVEVAGLKKGDSVLDVCAAPGGKTFQAADSVGEEGTVVARDLSEYKVDLIRENNERMRYSQIIAKPWDATVFDPAMEEKFDVVLADLPCSGLGIMGRKNDIKYHVTKAQLKDLVVLQRKMLSVVWRYVKPGGKLIFSTCTLNRGENEQNVRWIEENTPLRLRSIEESLPKALRGRSGQKGYLQLIPGEDYCDGFFVSAFLREREN